MLRFRLALFAVLLALLAVGCTTSAEFSAESLPTSDQSAVLAGEVAPELNAGAGFDTHIIENYRDFRPEQLGAIQQVVSSFCLDLVDKDSISYLTTDSELQDRILGTNDCDDFETVSAILQRSPSPGAATFEESVQARFRRVTWWYGLDEFFVHAGRYCRDRPSPGLASEADLELSVSVEIELSNMLEANECDLPRSGASAPTAEETEATTPPPLAQTEAALAETESEVEATPLAFAADGQPLDATLYYLDADEQIAAVHLASGAQSQVTALTGSTLSRAGSASVVPSPDGTMIAYGVKDSSETTIIAVGPSVQEAKVVTTRLGWTAPAWSEDGRYVLYDDSPSRVMRFDVAAGTSEVLVESVDNDGVFMFGGVRGESFLYKECPGGACRLVLADVETGEQRSTLDVGRGLLEMAPAGDLVAMASIGNNLTIIDVTESALTERSSTFLYGAIAPRISPDGQWMVSDALNSQPLRLASTELADSEQWLPLIDEPVDQWIAQTAWTPDSQSLIYSNLYDRPQAMRLIDLEGAITELPFSGGPIAVVAGDPERLAS